MLSLQCRRKTNQLKLFICGGAGTRTSYLIEYVYEMTIRKFQIIRRNDSQFASLPNRIWTASQSKNYVALLASRCVEPSAPNLPNRIWTASHSKTYVALLASRCVEPSAPNFPHDALHVYATTDKVDQHNTQRLSGLKEPL